MQLSEQERAHNREAFRSMSVGKKLQYIFAYYKLPLVIALIVVVALVSVMRYHFAHKDPVLYLAYTNVAVDEQLDQRISSGFLQALGEDDRTHEVYRYQGLYLSSNASTANHEYAYASKLKLMAATTAQELDVVLMNQESWDVLSNSRYLLDLEQAFDSADASLRASAGSRLRKNAVIIEDNAVEVDLREADEYQAQTTEVANALDITDCAAFADMDFSDRVYLGIIGNSPRFEAALEFARYLMGA